MKKYFMFAIILIIAALLITGCSTPKNKEAIVIYSSQEDFRNEHLLTQLKKEFPDNDIIIQYHSTGTNAAKLKAEGTSTDCDIVLGLDSAYLQDLEGILADLSSYDSSEYIEDLVPTNKKYFPWERYSGAIIVNRELLESKGLEVPTCYEDLTKEEYKGLISMPNPKASGTGYFYLLNLVNVMGEDQAFDYFDRLSPNILQYTSSGSGPVNTLIQGEAAIGLGMTFQAVNEINNGAQIEVLYFDEGAPYSTSGFAAIEGRLEKPEVKKVFDFLVSTGVYEDKELFSPEQIFKNQTISVDNYPQDIQYADMQGINDMALKNKLLDKWKY